MILTCRCLPCWLFHCDQHESFSLVLYHTNDASKLDEELKAVIQSIKRWLRYSNECVVSVVARVVECVMTLEEL